jgi:Tol biopolymer transport system component
MKKLSVLILCTGIILSACVPAQPNSNPTATADINQRVTETPAPAIEQTSPATLLPQPLPTDTFTPAPPPNYETQFLAYAQDGQLLVTNLTGGEQGGTTQYTVTGESDQVTDLAWSPSGESVAFTSAARGEPHIFYIFALGQSSPIDLGPGSQPGWSPDSQSVVYIRGTFPDDNIWITRIDNPAPRQLTFETNYAWGKPVFTPDGQSLIVAGTDRNNMGASANTSFTLEYLSLDGSGTRAPLPGTTRMEGVRLPYDLHFSPDHSRLAFSTSYHLSACASPGAYYVSNADGSNRQELVSPSLRVAIDPNKDYYHVGLSYAWNSSSDSIVASGNVVNCDFNSSTMGQSIAGPQMSILGLDGSERLIIPGTFYGMSVDRTGTLIAASHFKDFQDPNPMLEIYSAQTGQMTVLLGPGSNPQFQP